VKESRARSAWAASWAAGLALGGVVVGALPAPAHATQEPNTVFAGWETIRGETSDEAKNAAIAQARERMWVATRDGRYKTCEEMRLETTYRDYSDYEGWSARVHAYCVPGTTWNVAFSGTSTTADEALKVARASMHNAVRSRDNSYGECLERSFYTMGYQSPHDGTRYLAEVYAFCIPK
jgi:hypothetical protein